VKVTTHQRKSQLIATCYTATWDTDFDRCFGTVDVTVDVKLWHVNVSFHRAVSLTFARDLAKHELDLLGVQDVEDGRGVALKQQAVAHIPHSMILQRL
jgi:hypothetical protein